MTYRHEIYKSEDIVHINHNREITLQSGLITFSRLGSTSLGLDLHEKPVPSSLIVVRDKTPKLEYPIESVACNTLDEFVDDGTDRISKISTALGRVVRFDPHIEKIDNNPHLSDDERTALQQLHRSLFRVFGAQNSRDQSQSTPANSPTGLYL